MIVTWEMRRDEWARTPKKMRPKRGCWWCHGYGVIYFGKDRRAVTTQTKNSAPCEVCGEG